MIMHVHDEIILEMPKGEGSLEEALLIMCESLHWTKVFVLNSESHETE